MDKNYIRVEMMQQDVISRHIVCVTVRLVSISGIINRSENNASIDRDLYRQLCVFHYVMFPSK